MKDVRLFSVGKEDSALLLAYAGRVVLLSFLIRCRDLYCMPIQSFLDRKCSRMPDSTLVHGRAFVSHPYFCTNTYGSLVESFFDFLLQSTAALLDPDSKRSLGTVGVDARSKPGIVGNRQLKFVYRLSKSLLNVFPVIAPRKDDIAFQLDARHALIHSGMLLSVHCARWGSVAFVSRS
jgi:hypothetical protein